MLFLLDKDVRTVKWNGIPLHEASSAIVKEETNSDFYLTVRYPITDSGIYQLIKEDMLIKAPTPVLGAQLFRIKKPIENDDSLDITAYHVSDDIMKRSITPVSVVGQGCAMALSQMVQNAKTGLGDFSFTSDIMDSRTFNTTETKTLYSVLMDGKHSIVGTWEGELVRDNFALSIKRSRGADRGVVITTHKNLKSYQRTKNSQGVVTRIHARSTFKPDGAEDEVTLRVSVDSPLINSYPYINEKEYENNNAETVEDLRKWAEAKFTNEGIDKVSDAIEIEAYELDGQVVNLGDTVNLKSRKHSADLYKKAIAYEFNALTEEYISITFDDKPGVGGSGVSSGLSNVADAILVASATAQDVAVQRAVKNANAAFDAEFGKTKTKINDDIEIAKAKVESFKSELSNRMDNQLLPLATEAKNLASQAQADLTRKEIELRAELNRQVTSTEAVKISLTNLSHNMDIIKQKALNDLRDAETRLKEADSVQQLATKRVEDKLTGLSTKLESFSVGGYNYVIDGGEPKELMANFYGKTYDINPQLLERTSQATLSFSYEAESTSRLEVRLYKKMHTGDTSKITIIVMPNFDLSPGKGFISQSFDLGGVMPDPRNQAWLVMRGTNANPLTLSKVKLERGTVATDWNNRDETLKASFAEYKQTVDENLANLRTSTETLAGQLTSAESSIRQTSESFSNRLVSLETYKDSESNRASRNLVTGAVETGHVKAGAITGVLLAAEAVTAEKLKVDQAFFNKLMANDAYLKQLFAKSAFITQVQSVTISASQISGGVIKALNNAMEIQMNSGQILYYTDQAALKRVLSGYPTQFVKFATGTVSGKGNAGVTVIGSNRYGTESTNDGGFVGVRAWNGSNIDSLDLVGDKIRLASSAFDNSDGWDVRTLDSGLKITPHNRAAERNSRIEVGDVWILKGNGSYSSLRDILNSFNENFSKGPNADSYTYYHSGF
ncbi:TPA: phage tail spike protein [Streptococcus agalactiae]